MFPLKDLNPTRTTPVVTIIIVVVNVLVFFAWQPIDDPAEHMVFLYERAVVPCEVTNGAPLTIAEVQTGRCADGAASQALFPDKSIPLSVVISMFLHGGLLHLAGNMWFLWVFGNNVEEAFGHIGYLALYVAAGVLATLGFVLLNPGGTVPLIGASGAVAGVLGAYFVLYPTHLVISLIGFFVLPIPAIVLLGLWFLGQFLVTEPGVAWEAHVAGFLAGMAVTVVLRGALRGHVDRLHARRVPR